MNIKCLNNTKVGDVLVWHHDNNEIYRYHVVGHLITREDFSQDQKMPKFVLETDFWSGDTSTVYHMCARWIRYISKIEKCNNAKMHK